MHREIEKTVILYFTRSAREEARAKAFTDAAHFAQNKAIAENLIHHTYQEIQKSGLPVKICSSEHQIGDTFGDKLANAFHSLFDAGFQNVIAVGNDCPALTAAAIRNAGNYLQDNDAVFGPAADGGVYLLGLNRSAFEKEKFRSLTWETDHLLSDFERYCSSVQCSYQQLQLLSDIDDEKSLQVFLRKIHFSLKIQAFNLLLSIYFSAVNYFTSSEVHFSADFSQSVHSYRGPPAS